MDDNNKTTFNVEQTINIIIQGEIKDLINYKGAPFIKFQLLVTSIEFLGACLDVHKFSDNDQSEIRFNTALNKLFPKKYHKYAKKDSAINLFRELRCGMIHKLCPLSTRVRLTERKHFTDGEKVNATEIEGDLFLVLEDFYDDLDKACEKLKKLNKNKKLPSKKMTENYLSVYSNSTGNTESNQTILT